MKEDCEMKEIYSALSKAQAVMGGAAKDGVNPHFRSKYATLQSVVEALKKPFAENGLCHYAKPSVSFSESGQCVVDVEVVIAHVSGEEIKSVLSSAIQDMSPQKVGMTISYLRRYCLMALSGMPAEDDDAESATDHTQSKEGDSARLARVMAIEERIKRAGSEELAAIASELAKESDAGMKDRLRRSYKARVAEIELQGAKKPQEKEEVK